MASVTQIEKKMRKTREKKTMKGKTKSLMGLLWKLGSFSMAATRVSRWEVNQSLGKDAVYMELVCAYYIRL